MEYKKLAGLLVAATAMITGIFACSPQFDGDLSETLNKKGQARTFRVSQGKLLRPNGQEFIIRGVNTPHAYYKEASDNSLQAIKDYGFNTVRIVWCASDLIVEGRCGTYHMHDVSALETTLSKVKSVGLKAVLNLQNATGSNDPAYLDQMASWFVKDDVKKVLNAYEDILILNIANEWLGSWITGTHSATVADENAKQTYISSYKAAIAKMRDAGLNHVLVIDAAGYAQDFDSIAVVAEDLINQDSNIMFSAHLYDQFKNSERVQQVFSKVRTDQIPFLVGEFGCSHGTKGDVDCRTIMTEANGGTDGSLQKYGYIGWSYFGNSQDLSDLDMIDSQGNLTSWGQELVDSL